ncbi:hypothetical protein BH09MYX1_BH09MYX1_09140 [soil metagenome]
MSSTMLHPTLRGAALFALAITFACSAASSDTEGDFDDEGPTASGDGVETGVSEDGLSSSPALKWFQNHKGSTAYEHYCEKAVENSYGRTGVYASAIADWNAQGSKRHPGNLHPPRGALVFWKTSVFGHVGVADGNGGFCSTSINGRIGCAKLPYFSNYLGWAPEPF